MTDPLVNNRYKLVKLLGSGGYGETYLAQDTNLPSSPTVVLKRFKGQLNDPNVKRMFEKEAAALYSLGGKHKYIPRLHQYFVESNYFFLYKII
ncbi:MAG: hypothetical protein NW220_18645 [Leptolyngbyaceae cyanobacterium bins.349]|nr:hypothetical protein [Leptolyngbyaceae cyanobacterium bins.349]